jgi:hypothetical protein
MYARYEYLPQERMDSVRRHGLLQTTFSLYCVYSLETVRDARYSVYWSFLFPICSTCISTSNSEGPRYRDKEALQVRERNVGTITKMFNKSPVYITPSTHRHAHFLLHPPKKLKSTALFYYVLNQGKGFGSSSCPRGEGRACCRRASPRRYAKLLVRNTGGEMDTSSLALSLASVSGIRRNSYVGLLSMMAVQLFVGPWPLFQFLHPIHKR